MSSSRCPRCQAAFMCGAAGPEPCACFDVKLDAAQRAQLQQRYDGCLCVDCLRSLSAEAPKGAARGPATLAAAATTLLLGGCQGIGVLDPQGPVGAAERTILFNALAIMLAIVVPTLVATVGFAWWFRAGNTKARYRPDWAYSGRVELVVWSIPVLVVLFLGGICWIGSHALDPYRPLDAADGAKPLEVQVVSLDWKWLFIYPEQGVASVNRLVLPVGKPVHFTLTSASVMNAFFIPQLGSMIYTMNGMTTELHLQADRPGTYEGMSSHFSGDGFSGMRFQAEAVSADGFAAWLRGARASGPALDEAGYAALAKQSLNTPPSTYRSVDAHLFHAVAMQHIAPSAGPPAEPSPHAPGGAHGQ